MAKVDKIIERYKGKIYPRTINSLNNGDETPTKKYLEYMCKLWLEVRSSAKVIKWVKEFDELLPYMENKDIYHSDYSTYTKLLEAIEVAKDVKEEKTFIKEDNIDVLIENEKYIMLSPKTHRGSVKYGKGTKWCTAMTDYPGHFNDYKKDGYLVYLLRKKEEGDIWDKVAFYIEDWNVSFGLMDVFTSNDIEKNSRDFFSSSWSLEDINYISSFIRQYVTYCEYKKHAKREVNTIKDTLSGIDLIKLNTYKKILGEDNKDIFDKINKTISEINQQMASLKF